MTRLQILLKLNSLLISDMPQYQKQSTYFSKDEQDQWRLFRSLVNLREPKPISKKFIKLQDTLLQNEIKEKGITDITNLHPIKENIYLWQGDITTLKVDAIVNAANNELLGCFIPCHGCIDNAIHTYAGIQLRLECAKIMKAQGLSENTGCAKITGSYNLPCNYIIHTVGPIINGIPTSEECLQLASCYRACLDMALSYQLKSIAFCCISTGEFHFPNEIAAKIAINTVNDFLSNYKKLSIVFNVYKNEDLKIYQNLLCQDKKINN